MNPVIGQSQKEIDPDMWRDEKYRLPLAEHDFGAIFKGLQRVGFTQHRIATLTGVSQPQISAIMRKSGRRVMGYGVLVRIVSGLEIPLGFAGLSWCPDGHGEPPEGTVRSLW